MPSQEVISSIISAVGIAGAGIIGAIMPKISQWFSDRSAAKIQEDKAKSEIELKENEYNNTVWKDYCSKLIEDMKAVRDFSNKIEKDYLTSREEVFSLKAELAICKKELDKLQSKMPEKPGSQPLPV